MHTNASRIEALKMKALDEAYEQLLKDISTFPVKITSQSELDAALLKLEGLNRSQDALFDAATALPEKNNFRKKVTLYHQHFPHIYYVLQGDLHYHFGLFLIENYIKHTPIDTLSMLKKAQHCFNECIRLYETKACTKPGFFSPQWFEYLEEKLNHIKTTLQSLYR